MLSAALQPLPGTNPALAGGQSEMRVIRWLAIWAAVSIWIDSVRYELGGYATLDLTPASKIALAVLRASVNTGLLANGMWYLGHDLRYNSSWGYGQANTLYIRAEDGQIKVRSDRHLSQREPKGDCGYYHPRPDREGRAGPTAAVILGPAHPCYDG